MYTFFLFYKQRHAETKNAEINQMLSNTEVELLLFQNYSHSSSTVSSKSNRTYFEK